MWSIQSVCWIEVDNIYVNYSAYMWVVYAREHNQAQITFPTMNMRIILNLYNFEFNDLLSNTATAYYIAKENQINKLKSL